MLWKPGLSVFGFYFYFAEVVAWRKLLIRSTKPFVFRDAPFKNQKNRSQYLQRYIQYTLNIKVMVDNTFSTLSFNREGEKVTTSPTIKGMYSILFNLSVIFFNTFSISVYFYPIDSG